MLSRRSAIVLLLCAAVLADCKRKPAIPPDVIARVNDRMITIADFKHYLDRNAGTELAQLTPEAASALLDQFVEEILVSEYAAARGVEVPAEKIAAAVRTEAGATVIEKRDEMRREKLIGDLAAAIPEPTDADVEAYYTQHPGDFRSAEELKVRQILVHDENLANEIVAKLRGGAPFPELSAQYSLAPNAKRGGEIGFVSRGELPKMFEDVIFQLQPGQFSDVIQTESSYHIFEVDERRAAGMLDVQTAAPLIRSRLKEDALRNQLSQLVGQSRKTMRIAVLTRRLPFHYSGTLPKAAAE